VEPGFQWKYIEPGLKTFELEDSVKGEEDSSNNSNHNGEMNDEFAG